MKNIHLDERTARDIDDRIARVHRDLDYSDGKVNLAEVRDILSLDLQYYSANDADMLDEVVHKLKVGVKQVIKRPALLIEAIQKLELRALFLPDRKRILIDSDLPDLKKRWSEGHEISHSLIPWHGDYMLGDNQATLSPSCHEQIEAEANYGGGCLLFPTKTFDQLRRSTPLNISQVRAIATHFGNTITSTLWRCVERHELPCFGVIGEHPRYPREGRLDVEHLIRSERFEREFSTFTEADATELLRSYCGYKRGGPLGSAEIIVPDVTGALHVFHSETFCVKHYTLSLAQYVRPKETVVFISS